MTGKLKPAKRILDLSPYLFREIDLKKKELIAKGRKLINLGVGDPDLPTPDFVVQAMEREIGKNENQKYPDYEGKFVFRKAVSDYMQKSFKVSVDPEKEVIALIGSKEGLAHFSWAFIEEGDLAIVPDPAYPVYRTTVKFSGGEVFPLPLRETNGFLPDLTDIPDEVARKAKAIFLNYPNNPTGAMIDRESLEKIVAWARKNEVIVVSDAAYSELVFDQSRKLSLLSIPGAREVGIEFHSFSKTFNMTGWRVGFAVGNCELISGLLKLKTNVDSGVFDAIQLACVAGLKEVETFVKELVQTYRERRDLLIKILQKYKFELQVPAGAFYVWAKCPEGLSSKDCTLDLLEKTGIVTTPGSGFGVNGEGFVRFALTQSVKVLAETDELLKSMIWRPKHQDIVGA